MTSFERDQSRRLGIPVLLIVTLTASGCGKKGDPLAPLRLVPSAVTEISVRQVGNEVQLKFVLPTTNLNGPGRIDLDRVEIYAMTVAPGVAPPNRDLLTKGHVVGAISVKPPPPPGEQPEDAEPDKRPGPGDHVSFAEKLTPEKLKPEAINPATEDRGSRGGARGSSPSPATEPPDQKPGAAGTPQTPASKPEVQTPKSETQTPKPEPGATNPQPAVANPESRTPNPEPQATANYPTRVYSVRGISKGGRPGQTSTRVVVPVVPPAAPPTGLDARVGERALTLAWTPPVAEPGGPALAFNVYRAASDSSPLNASPVTAPTFDYPSVEFEKEQCFVVRAIATVQNVSLESEASATKCITPHDTFPPAPPKGLSAVSPPGSIQLTWDANTEADLAGYRVLRADAPGETLRPLTPEPIHDASFNDQNIKPGVSYEYAVIAIDRNGNASAPSQRLAVTAR
jgi:hypothetical protein